MWVNGVFNTESGYTIVDDHGWHGHGFPKPMPLMTEQERFEQQYKYLKICRSLRKWFQLYVNEP
jgi:hypothetical protein